MTSAIPKAALDDRLAFVGTSGSGKTYAAGTAVERLLSAGAKVVIVDPLDVWWGLRVKADGVKPAFPVVIFGGARADLPLTEHAGALIGEAVAGMAESCIVSLGGMATKSAERRFMLAFLEKLYRRATGEPFHIIFDEADLWAPQKSSEPQLQNLMEQIVRRGRVKGFIPWLITQRPAVLSKDVLSQADGLVAMKLTSSQDRDALGAWIEGQADRSDEKRMLAKLPTMQKGHGIVWIPGRGVLEEAAFPAKSTFDSSSTPKRGEVKRTATLKPIDLGKLKERMASLEDQGKSKPKQQVAGAAPVDARVVREVEDRAKAEGVEIGKRIGFAEGQREALRAVQAAVGSIKPNEPSLVSLPSRPPVQRPPVVTTAGDAGVVGQGGLRRIMIALAQCPRGLTNRQIGIRAGLSSKSGTFSTYLSTARTNGWIEGRGLLQITSSGIAALGSYEPLPSGPALLDHWLRELGDSGAARLLRVIAEAYPHSLTNEEAGEKAELSHKSGTFSTYLSKLRTLELISGRGELRASDDFFLDAA
jgi:uncharacterized protein